jgi:hypothetical protein
MLVERIQSGLAKEKAEGTTLGSPAKTTLDSVFPCRPSRNRHVYFSVDFLGKGVYISRVM